jgi:glycosyltransferase involved in cell wall biosynthesis
MSKADKTHVLIAIPSLLLGGTEIQTLSVVKVLIAAGYKVSVCCYYESADSVSAEYKAAGAEVVLMGLKRSRNGFGITAAATLLRSLMLLFREKAPAIVHAQYITPGLIPILAARLAGIETIFGTVHFAWTPAYGNKARLMLRTAARLCTAFFCVSRGAEMSWFGSGAVREPRNEDRKHYTIHNAVDLAGIDAAVRSADRGRLREHYRIPDNVPVIGAVGRLDVQKGHSVLLDALAAVMRDVPNCLILIAGAGPERTKLEEKARHHGIDHAIRWAGSCPQQKVFELYSVMDMLVMPSASEGFGLSAAEAMAACLPVIGTGVGGLSEVIAHGVTGYLVRPGDSADLAAAIVELLRNPERGRALGKEGRARVEEKFSMPRFAETMLNAYERFSG